MDPSRRLDDSADYGSIDPRELASRLDDVLTTGFVPQEWAAKHGLAATYVYDRHPSATPRDREAAARFSQGEFGLPRWPWLRLGVPPPWDLNPLENRTWDFQRHSLTWLYPLLASSVGQQEPEYLRLAEQVIIDWIEHNSVPPGASTYAWNDNSTANRIRIICWFWELWRGSPLFDEQVARLLVASAYQHATYLAADDNYRPRSNHGLMMNGALIATAVTFAELNAAARWYEIANRRLVQYVDENFSTTGFHLEQSPAYHGFVTRRLGHIVRFMSANGLDVPEEVTLGLGRAASVWPYLPRPDHSLPSVGDSFRDEAGPRMWVDQLRRELGREEFQTVPSSQPNPRGDGGSFLLDFDAGYAIFLSYPVARPDSNGTHLLYKCNSFKSTHWHHDALSFTLHHHAKEWLVDPGPLNAEERTSARAYMRSARAHNVVLVDDEDFGSHPVTLVAYGRSAEADYVTAFHDMPGVRHHRVVRFLPPATTEVIDRLEATDGRPHFYTQLFHVAPDINTFVEADRAHLYSDEDSCQIRQRYGGVWQTIAGQSEPTMQGWYSPSFGKMVPAPVLCFSNIHPTTEHVFETQIEFQAAPLAEP